MTSTNAVVTTWTGEDEMIDKLEAWSELTAEEASFLASYQTALSAGNTNVEQDLKFKVIFDRWFMYNMG